MPFSLSPIGNDQQLDGNGNPLAGGKLYTYLAGSSTPVASYTSNTGSTAQANPIILNALGRPDSPVWLTDGTSYKFVLHSAADVEQWTIDNVTGVTVSTPAQSEWDTLNTVPTYINATQFSVPGDQTSVLLVGGRLRLPCTGGVRYGVITVSAYTSLTTVTVELDSGVLDAGLSSVSVGILSPENGSMPWLKSNSTGLTMLGTLTLDANAAAALQAVPLQQMQAADAAIVRGRVRQTVISGPVDSSGVAAFGGSTGSTTVTASGTLIASSANGFGVSGAVDLVGSIANPSWTSLSTNGTMYLYLTVNTDGTCTTGSTTLAPVYQQGGTYSTTSGQFTFNVAEMVGKVGDGSAANQAYRVYVGQVTVSGGVVSAIVWYALNGRYEVSGVALPAVGTATSRNHNIGTAPKIRHVLLVNGSTELNYAVGDEVPVWIENNGGTLTPSLVVASTLTISTVRGSTATLLLNKTTGVSANITPASWSYKFFADRGW